MGLKIERVFAFDTIFDFSSQYDGIEYVAILPYLDILGDMHKLRSML